MPVSSTGTCAAFSRARMARRFFSVSAGGMPRSMSLQPSSRITASGWSASDQSSRARPAGGGIAADPGIGHHRIDPVALQRGLKLHGEFGAGRQAIALGQAGAQRQDFHRRRPCLPCSRHDQQQNYAKQRLERPRHRHSNPEFGMNNPPPALQLQDISLTLKSLAGPVDILAGVSLSVARGRKRGPDRAVGLGQILAADGGGGAGKAQRRPHHGHRHRHHRHGRGCAGAFPAGPGGHGVPELSSDPHHDGAGECRGAAGTDGRAGCLRPRRSANCAAWA